MSSNGSGKRLEEFLTGKGFYIVLFLCAAVVGVSAWMMVTGNETIVNDESQYASVDRVETIVISPTPDVSQTIVEQAPEIVDEGLAETTEQTEEAAQPVIEQEPVEEVAAPMYMWPVSGELERGYSADTLYYDVTMADWRTHEALDILAPVGTEVVAAHSGTVESVEEHDLYGVTVTVDHGDGSKSVYANLDAATAVNTGDWVEPGNKIGTVGSTAICEISQQEHLHFAIVVDGKAVNPLDYLPA